MTKKGFDILLQSYVGSVVGYGNNSQFFWKQEIKKLEQINAEKDMIIAEKEYPHQVY